MRLCESTPLLQTRPWAERESCGTCGSAASIACAPGAASCLPRDMPCVETRQSEQAVLRVRTSAGACTCACVHVRACVRVYVCALVCVRGAGELNVCDTKFGLELQALLDILHARRKVHQLRVARRAVRVQNCRTRVVACSPAEIGKWDWRDRKFLVGLEGAIRNSEGGINSRSLCNGAICRAP